MSSRRIPDRYPASGTSEIADRIRVRRGAKGLTPLDGALLYVPPVADGWEPIYWELCVQKGFCLGM